MNLKRTLLALSFLTATTLSAQQASVRFGMHAATPRACASMEVLERQVAADPALAQRMEEVERHTQQFIANGGHLQTRAIITIPVVFHIVSRNATENISDAQIQAQIDVLNKDFRKANPDASSIPAAFAGLAADCEIQFCLAKRTPTGAATTGINRISSTRTTDWGTNDAVKTTVPAWDANKYLNIWVCGIGGGILGYAQFPGGAAATDGVVLDYRYTGVGGTATTPYHLGRTATHEVGHWLNLRHIWGDANCGSDLVNDTPTQQTSNGGCPTFPRVTCNNGPNGDMFMNYMDYTYDACMYMFSAGQKARMLALFGTGGSRSKLLTSDGCTPPSTTTCGLATNLAASSITSTTATISWTPPTGVTASALEYRIVGAANYTILTGITSPRALTGLTANSTYEYRIVSSCGTSGTSTTTNLTFATPAVVVACTDANEPNESTTAAKIITLGAATKGLIAKNTDRDWFKFTTTATARNIRVALTNLPADYDVKLYNSAGTQLAVSAAGGTTAESIKYNTTLVGTYYVQVYPYSTAFNATSCYTLTVSTTASTARMSNEGNEEGLVIAPNPANTELFITLNNFSKGGLITVSMLNLAGQEVLNRSFTSEKDENSVSKDIVSYNVSDIPSGMYILRVSDEEGVVEVKKVMIMR
ncbi:MAG: hypothetical protein RL757_703 [Bacteroidota bacterium]|jgi:hypothetical protein